MPRSARIKRFITSSLAAGAAASFLFGAAPSSAAALTTGSLTLLTPSVRNAADTSSKGLVFADWDERGYVDVLSTTMKSGSAQTTSKYGDDGLELKYGTHKVTTTVKYRPYSTRSKTVYVNGQIEATLSSCQRSSGIARTPSEFGEDHTRFTFMAVCITQDTDPDHVKIEMSTDLPSDSVVNFPADDSYNVQDFGFSPLSSAFGDFNYTMVAYQKIVKSTTYGKTMSITKAHTVKVGNSGTMTYREYKRVTDGQSVSKVGDIVGSKGKVTSRWSSGGHEYTTRAWQSHRVYFDNGRVYAKEWQ